MDWLTTLRRSGGINALSRQLGVSPVEVAAGAEALLPAIVAGARHFVDRHGSGEAGARALVASFAEFGGGQLAADVMGPAPLDILPGLGIVDLLIGPDVARRAVLAEADRVGLDPVLGERVLPGLAMLVGGYVTALAMGSGAKGSGGLRGVIDSLAPNGDASAVDRI